MMVITTLGYIYLDPSVVVGRRPDRRTGFKILGPTVEYKMSLPCCKCGEAGWCWFPDVPCFRCCDICRTLKANAMAVIHNDILLDKAIRAETKHTLEYHKREKPRSHSGNGAPQGAFAFTLTSSPTDGLTKEDMVAAVRKVMAQQSCPVVKYAWYLEYGDKELKTHPHIHGMYETITLGRIEAKHWKRAWRIWDEKVRMGAGFRGGYHRPIRDGEAYADYIRKDAEEVGVSDRSEGV